MDDRDVVLKGNDLAGKRIDFVVCGGIASIQSPRLVRELRRYGAEVRVIMTANAENFVTPLVFEWASKQKPITQLTGSAEHLSSADAVVVAPATLDFMAKVSHGFADSPAATLLQSVLERRPVIFLPSMHESLRQSPSYKESRPKLEQLSRVYFVDGEFVEGKQKSPEVETAVQQIIHFIHRPQNPKRALITLGGTRAALDDVRFLSNFSSGRTGLEIAEAFFRQGFDVKVLKAQTDVNVPRYLHPLPTMTNHQMFIALQSEGTNPPDVWIHAAAVLDFEPEEAQPSKISSAHSWTIPLRPSKKIIQAIDWPNTLKVAFKLESKISDEELKSEVKEWQKNLRVNFIVANRLENVSASSYSANVYSRQKDEWFRVDSRAELAKRLVTECGFKSEALARG